MYKIIEIYKKNKNRLNKMHKIKLNDIPNDVKNKKIYAFIHPKFKNKQCILAYITWKLLQVNQGKNEKVINDMKTLHEKWSWKSNNHIVSIRIH